MGWVADPTVRITLHFRDDDGASSTHIINVAADALPVAGAFAAAYAALFAPLTSCALYKVGISLRYLVDPAPVAVPGADTNTHRRSVFVFQSIGSPYVLSLPGVIGAKLVQPPDPYAYVGLNTADPAIAALVSAMVTGIGGVEPCAPWAPTLIGGGGGGGSWGGGGGGGSWGGGGGTGASGPEPEDYTWSGSDLTALLAAYWGYERAGRR